MKTFLTKEDLEMVRYTSGANDVATMLSSITKTMIWKFAMAHAIAIRKEHDVTDEDVNAVVEAAHGAIHDILEKARKEGHDFKAVLHFLRIQADNYDPEKAVKSVMEKLGAAKK